MMIESVANGRSTFICSNFDEPVLYSPARKENECPCTSLKIITAFTDCERIAKHMINLSDGMKTNRFEKGISVDIILGMTKSSLSEKKHNEICKLLGYLNETKGMPKVSCRYISNGAEVHSKIYLWNTVDKTLGETPFIAYCGSLNYTMNAFYKRRETMSMCNSMEAFKYYKTLVPDTIDCFDSRVFDKIKNIKNNNTPALDEVDNCENDYDYYDKLKTVEKITVSLLKADGSETGYGSGINWGIRKNGLRRNPNQAYIPYNKKDKVAGFFPDRVSPDDENCPIFKVITKDFGFFHMRMAQDGNKGLHSAESNAILGEWIRKRLGVPSGGYITKQMLEIYGKTYVTFRKYDDGTYLLDF